MTDFNVHYVERIDSTNTRLMQWAARQDCHRVVMVADEQTAGRGQRGRQWLSAPAEALLCSVAWRFDRSLALDGLSLAVGVMLADALCGLVDGAKHDRLRLKWPNDLLIDETHKLGGILIETIASAGGTRTAVIGVGVNLKTPMMSFSPDALPGIGLDLWSGRVDPRDAVLQCFLTALGDGLEEFGRRGFAAFQARWWARCAFLTRPVAVRLPDGKSVTGRLHSISERGALVIESERGLHTLISGEVSLRVASA